MSTRGTGFDKAKEKAKQWLKDKFHRSEQLFTTVPGAVDARTIGRVEKATRKLTEFCLNKRLNLKNSPPYLQGILFDNNEHFRRIFSNNSLGSIKECPYLNLAVRKFLMHSRMTIKLFREAREQMEYEDSEYRRQLNKYTLVFSHMLTELKAVYKDGRLDQNFVIVKIEARRFWHLQFGQRLVVSWEELLPVLQMEHNLSENEAPALKNTMDITENNHISWFEFDVFTRLFQPWGQLINNWYVLALNHPAYKAFITYDEVEAILRQHVDKPGSYVYRLSCTRLGQWAIGFVTRSKKIVQTIPQNKSLYQALLDGVEEGLYLYPDGQDIVLDLKRMISDAPEQRIQVTKEEYDIYCDMDSSFELCKICNANLKSVRMEPCGHLMCNDCLSKWTATSRQATTCPFCRKPVLSMENIVVAPFDPLADDSPNSNNDDEDDEDDDDQVNQADLDELGELFNAQRCSSAPPPPVSGPLPSAPQTSSRNRGLPPLPTSNPQEPTRQGSSEPERMLEGPPVDSDRLHRLIEMGFPEDQSVKALKVSRNDLDMATNILLSFSS